MCVITGIRRENGVCPVTPNRAGLRHWKAEWAGRWVLAARPLAAKAGTGCLGRSERLSLEELMQRPEALPPAVTEAGSWVPGRWGAGLLQLRAAGGRGRPEY